MKDEFGLEKPLDIGIKHVLGVILIAIAIIIIILSFAIGSHEVASTLSLGGFVLILLIEGFRLSTGNYHSKHIKQVHEKLERIEVLIKNDKKL